MLSTFACTYFRRAFGWSVPIGALASLVGLGGGEFRLPVLMHSIGFSARSAVPVNLAVTLVALAAALGMRSQAVSLADTLPYAVEVAGLVFGGVISAFYGPPLVKRLANKQLIQIIAVLLAMLGVLLWTEALFPFSNLEILPTDPAVRFATAAILGLGIGLVSSLLGVAGGELLIPALMFIFGADIVTAGSTAILISLCLVSVGLWRYWHIQAFPRGRGIQRIIAAMSLGSLIGAGIGGLMLAFVSTGSLKLLLGAVLIAAAAKTLFTERQTPAGRPS